MVGMNKTSRIYLTNLLYFGGGVLIGIYFRSGLPKCLKSFLHKVRKNTWFNKLDKLFLDKDSARYGSDIVNCPGPGSTEAGEASACETCPNKPACMSGSPPAEMSDIKNSCGKIRKKIAIMSGKGGVGKSTTAAQLAWALSKKWSVGLLDIDICGPSIPRMTNTLNEGIISSGSGWIPVDCNGLKVMSIGYLLSNPDSPIIWRGPKKNNLIRQFLGNVEWNNLDILIVDTPPGTSDEHLSLVTYLQTVGIDGILLVTTPQEVALQDIRKEINFCLKANLRIIGLVENMANSLFSQAGIGNAPKVCEEMNIPYLMAININPEIISATENGRPVVDSDFPDSPNQQYSTMATLIAAKLDLVDETKDQYIDI